MTKIKYFSLIGNMLIIIMLACSCNKIDHSVKKGKNIDEKQLGKSKTNKPMPWRPIYYWLNTGDGC